jgi:hypothetical protein
MSKTEKQAELERAFEKWLIATLAHERAQLAVVRLSASPTEAGETTPSPPPHWQTYLQPH